MCPRPSNGRNSSLFPHYLPVWHSWLCRRCLAQSDILRDAWFPGDTSTGPRRLEAAEPAQHRPCQRSSAASHAEKWFSVTSAWPALPATQHRGTRDPQLQQGAASFPGHPQGAQLREGMGV